jgi:ADP-heptose:LPS heptosyltransferase
VGGNEQKRLPNPFEEHLLLELLKDGCTVLLDKGAGGEEVERANRLVEHVREEGWPVAELAPPSGLAAIVGKPLPVRLVTWQGGIGTFSALVAETDEYIGYDSAGQHIAAALGVPTIDVFSRNASPIFRERWRPTGRNTVKVVSECPPDGTPRPAGDVLKEVLSLHREVLRK